MEKNFMVVEEKQVVVEAVSKAKSEFLENMRHDIRTPLTGITSVAKKIREEVDSVKIKEYADSILASSNALQDFLNEILETIHVSSGRVPLYKNKFDLKKCLAEIVNLNLAKATEKHLDLSVYYDANIPNYLVGDVKRIQRIVLELVTNALNFTDTGSVKICACLAKKEDRNVIVKISVTDTGIGIPSDKQQEIFLRFKRALSSKGAGLGLAVIKEFIDDLKGEIYVESKLNIGSIFTCVIPLKEALLSEVEIT
jgi:two-component system, OmpR family, aerobic respiration control sensor histidine kinase ArcB